MLQAQSRVDVLAGVERFGVAPGGRKMMDIEEEAAENSIQTGMYITWRSSNGTDCTRIGPKSKCFCGHMYGEHRFISPRAPYPRCTTCDCSYFAYIPQRPEEVGEWWLVRRKGFNIHTWRAKCKCGHGHDEHEPNNSRRCRCGCKAFVSDFACLVCDKKWEDHETVFATTQERLVEGRSIGDAYRPLASDPTMRSLVFAQSLQLQGGSSLAQMTAVSDSQDISRFRPKAVSGQDAEKSVRIMAASSGGSAAGSNVSNTGRWGKVAPQSATVSKGPPTRHSNPSSLLCGTGNTERRGDERSSVGRMPFNRDRGSLEQTPSMAGGLQGQEPEKKIAGSGFRPVYD